MEAIRCKPPSSSKKGLESCANPRTINARALIALCAKNNDAIIQQLSFTIIEAILHKEKKVCLSNTCFSPTSVDLALCYRLTRTCNTCKCVDLTFEFPFVSQLLSTGKRVRPGCASPQIKFVFNKLAVCQ